MPQWSEKMIQWMRSRDSFLANWSKLWPKARQHTCTYRILLLRIFSRAQATTIANKPAQTWINPTLWQMHLLFVLWLSGRCIQSWKSSCKKWGNIWWKVPMKWHLWKSGKCKVAWHFCSSVYCWNKYIQTYIPFKIEIYVIVLEITAAAQKQTQRSVSMNCEVFWVKHQTSLAWGD